MEKQPKSKPETISYYERQRLLKKTYETADFYLGQMIAAPVNIRGIYIPVLSTVKLLWDGELSAEEQAHMRKIVAAQSDHLREVHAEVGSITEFRDTVYELAGGEIDEYNSLGPAQRDKSREWKLASKDASKVFHHVAFALKDLES